MNEDEMELSHTSVSKRKLTESDYSTPIGCKKLTKSQQNRLYYEKNKQIIKEKRIKRKKDASGGETTGKEYVSEKSDTVISTCDGKISKSERNRLYYQKNKDKIKAARMKDYNNPIKKASKLAAMKEYRAIPEKKFAKLATMKELYKDPFKKASKLAAMKEYRKIPEKRAARLAAMKKSYNNPINKASKLAAVKDYQQIPEKRSARLTAMKESYMDPVRKASKLASMKAYREIPEKRSARLAAMKELYKDPIKHATILDSKKQAYAVPSARIGKLATMKQNYKDPQKRADKLARNRGSYHKYRSERQMKRNEKNKDYDFLLHQARLAMLEMPVLACTVCHRARFKEQVKECHRAKYPQSGPVHKCFTGKYIHQCPPDCNDSSVYHDKKRKEWICFTCHKHLLKGNVPPQAAINNLWLDDIPEELKTLNALEMHLVSIVQPFMKIVPLPRGAQKGVRGQMVCVPANLQRTADSLPWTLNTNNLIRVKLKRKQEYKGHHLYMVVSQKRVMAALKKLMEINPAYEGKIILDLFEQ